MGGTTIAVSEELVEDATVMNAMMLGMGADNYDRLCKVLPDSRRRAVVVQQRLDRKMRVGLARALERSVERMRRT